MRRLNKLILLIFIVVGSILRVYNIGFQNFWTEEAYSLNMSSLPIIDLVFKSFASDFNPPLYYIFAHLSLLLTNGYDVAIRYPSVIAGVLLIPAMFYLGEQYKDELTGLYCAGLTTIILPFIYYSQFGRAYSISLLCFTIALILYLKLKDGDNHLDIRIAFWIMVVINLYVHLFALIPLSLMCLDLLTDKKNWLCGIGAIICSLPLVGMLVSVLSTRTHVVYSYGASMLQMVVLTPMEFFNSLFLNIIVLAGAGMWLYKNKLRWNLIVITAVTLIVGVVASAYTPFFPRYYMTVALIVILMASVGMVSLTELLNKKVGFDLKYVIMLGIFAVFVWQEWPNLVSHYTIMQYVC